MTVALVIVAKDKQQEKLSLLWKMSHHKSVASQCLLSTVYLCPDTKSNPQ